MQSWMERTSPNLVPIKSSLSIILGDVWSNTVCESADRLWNCGDDVHQLDVFAQRLAARKEDAQEREKRTKKSRQVFTCSQPPVAGIVADLTGKDIEVYESNGAQDMGSFRGMEPHFGALNQACQPCVTGPSPQALESDMRQSTRDFASGISLPKLQARSECELKTCFPSPAKPSLFYTVSDSSLPILKRSSMALSRLSSQMPVLLEKTLGVPPIIPMYDIRSGCFPCDLLGRSIIFNGHCKDVLIKYKNMDDTWAREIARTIQTANKRRGKFMSYAKFNSSFKLSEVFYEDINSKLSHGPSFRLSGLIHRVNPEFDENQSMSEAMTLMSLSPITSMSRVATVCRMAKSVNSITTGDSYDWAKSDTSSKTDPKPTKHDTVSLFRANSGVSLAQFVTAARKQQLSKLQDLLRSTFQGRPKETDIWSSSTSGCQENRSTPKKLVSASCIFRASATDRKLPVWKLKLGEPGTNSRTDLVNSLTFKAQNYMQMRGRPSHRCFFQRPTYRVVDEGVQFPDVPLTWDRSSNVKDPLTDDQTAANADDPGPTEPVLPDRTSSANDNPRNQDPPTDLKVLVACDKPFYSTSESHAMAETSSANLPASTSSNKCRSSSEYCTTSTAIALQPRNRKLDPAPNTKFCRNRGPPEASRFCHSYRALCDKRRIKIKYENGKYTVLKEKERAKRQTVWSIITGKATHLLNSVVRRKKHVRQPSGH